MTVASSNLFCYQIEREAECEPDLSGKLEGPILLYSVYMNITAVLGKKK